MLICVNSNLVIIVLIRTACTINCKCYCCRWFRVSCRFFCVCLPFVLNKGDYENKLTCFMEDDGACYNRVDLTAAELVPADRQSELLQLSVQMSTRDRRHTGVMYRRVVEAVIDNARDVFKRRLCRRIIDLACRRRPPTFRRHRRNVIPSRCCHQLRRVAAPHGATGRFELATRTCRCLAQVDQCRPRPIFNHSNSLVINRLEQ